jgi:hypothetical protein
MNALRMFLDIKYEICVAFPLARPEELDGKVGNVRLGNIMNEVQARVIDGSTAFEVLVNHMIFPMAVPMEPRRSKSRQSLWNRTAGAAMMSSVRT